MKIPFWCKTQDELFKLLKTSSNGLNKRDALKRFKNNKVNLLSKKSGFRWLRLFISQFSSPLVLMLLICAIFLYFQKSRTDATIIFGIVIASGLLGYFQEQGAANAIDKLLGIVQVKATVLRNGSPNDVPVEKVVPGDIVLLNAGDIIPGDGLILESKDFFIDEAALTGETYPVEKQEGLHDESTQLSQRLNSVFMGTHVVSGTAKVLVVAVGKETVFGEITEKISFKASETEFERGVRQFGYFLIKVTFILVTFIFVLNIYLERPFFEALLFSLALAVGLTPQLLPAIISINLAHGAKKMAKKDVIVKKLTSIENFGSMNILCADKTGTLTKGVLEIKSYLGIDGNNKDKIALFAYLNALFQTGYTNPIDTTIVQSNHIEHSKWEKEGELPYDFFRKRLSVACSKDNQSLLITKGAFSKILDVCTTAEESSGKVVNIDIVKEDVQNHFEKFSSQGLRVIGVAYKNIALGKKLSHEDEKEMTLLGFVILADPIKEGASKAIADLKKYGVSLKIITGDNRYVAAYIAKELLSSEIKVLTGPELLQISDSALFNKVQEVDLFAEVEPNQKERLILALRKRGNVVGYIGDGINDVSAMNASDVSISVESAVDSAKEVADIVLLKKNLAMLLEGIKMGRITFANTLKYVLMATSANFGNMFSMAGASLFLSFLPLLPKQVLFLNLLTDLPEMAIATDSVDYELIEKPHRWNVAFIRKFMLVFGLISSIFDYLTFFVLIYILDASQDLFRSGWFLESVISATMIVLVIRTRRVFYKSRPSIYLLLATVLVIGLLLILPFTSIISNFGFVSLPPRFFVALGVILVLYIATAEYAKKLFYRNGYHL